MQIANGPQEAAGELLLWPHVLRKGCRPQSNLRPTGTGQQAPCRAMCVVTSGRLQWGCLPFAHLQLLQHLEGQQFLPKVIPTLNDD